MLDFSSRGYSEYIPRNTLLGLSKHESLKKDNKNISNKLDAILREIIPDGLVNDFGICPRVMRCLEVCVSECCDHFRKPVLPLTDQLTLDRRGRRFF